MASTPRATLDDSYTLGITCAICGADALKVNHVPNLPDYVTCTDCSSAFLVEEGGDRVFYGQIAEGFGETERFALKQWAWLEAIETRAREERPAPPDTQTAYPSPDLAAMPEETATPEEAAPAAQGLSAEEWISSEIPREDLIAEAAEEQLADRLGDALPPDQIEPGTGLVDMPEAEVEPVPFRRLDMDEDRVDSELVSEGAEDQGLADFFEALTDDTGEVAPIAEPDEFLPSEETPVKAALDADLERLLETEEDTGPDLPPPPWAAKGMDEPSDIEREHPEVELPLWEQPQESPTEAEVEPAADSHEDTFDDLPAWEEFEGEMDDDAIPVVGAKEETYESLPAWKHLEESTPIGEPDAEPEPPDWASSMDAESFEETPVWGAFDEGEPGAESEAVPETPDWALPDKQESLSPVEGEEKEDFDWGAEVPTPGWQEIPGDLSDAEAVEEDDFLSGLRRSAGVPLESQPVADQPLSDFEEELDSGWDFEEEDLSARMEAISQPVEQPKPVAAGWEMTAAAAAAPKKPEPEPALHEFPDTLADVTEEPYVPPASDPFPGQRYRVVIRGERVVFPGGECAHCGRTPVKGKLAVAGTLPRGQAVGQRRPTRFEIPLCASCHTRAAAKSEDAKAAQLQAHLISAIAGMILVVGALALNLINPRDLGIVDLFLGLILLIVGYGGPAFFLLNRVGNFLPPVDARYVRRTLLIPSETQGLETAFEWRNKEYAQRFLEANQANTLGNVTSVKDRIA
jgi:hypothetical protein